MTRKGLSPAEVDGVWRRWRSGLAVKVLARQMRVNPSTVRDLLKRIRGIRPVPRRRWDLRLGLGEREEISRGLAVGKSLGAIAAGLGRPPSTVCREVAGNGGRCTGRAGGSGGVDAGAPAEADAAGRYRYQPVDQYGGVIDVMLSGQRDT